MFLHKKELLSLGVRVDCIKLEECEKTLACPVNDNRLKLIIQQLDTGDEVLKQISLLNQSRVVGCRLRVNIDALV